MSNKMLNLTNRDAVTMNSREIAELTGKQLKHVNRDIRTMLDALGDGPNPDHVDFKRVFEHRDHRGYTASFDLDREMAMTLVTGYSPKLRHAVVQRMYQLDEERNKPQVPNFEDSIEMAQYFIDSQKENRALTYELDEANRTKGQISDTQTATALATASVQTRRANKLQKQLDEAMSQNPEFKDFVFISQFIWRLGEKATRDERIAMGRIASDAMRNGGCAVEKRRNNRGDMQAVYPYQFLVDLFCGDDERISNG